MGQQSCFFACSPLLPFLATGQLGRLFGLSLRLFLLPTCQFRGLLRCSGLGALFSLDLGPSPLSLALLCFAALFLELGAFGHSAQRIQALWQGLSSHAPLRQTLLAT